MEIILRLKLIGYLTLLITCGLFAQSFYDDFESGDLSNYSPDTPSRWTIEKTDGDNALMLKTTAYSTKNERLGEINRIKNVRLKDFEFECEIKTIDTNPSADLALVFGYQDDYNYYLLGQMTATLLEVDTRLSKS